AVVHVSLVKEASAYRVVSMRPELMPLATVAEQPRFVRRFMAAHERARTWAATPLGTAGPGFSARYGRVEDTPLLDFINEVQRRRAGADLSAAAALPRAPVPRSGRRRGGQPHARPKQLPPIGWRRLRHAPGCPRRVRPGRVDPRPARGRDPDTRASDRAGRVLAQLVPGAGRGP